MSFFLEPPPPSDIHRSYRLGHGNPISLYDQNLTRYTDSVGYPLIGPTRYAGITETGYHHVSPVVPGLCQQLQKVSEDKVKLAFNEAKAREAIVFLRNELGRLSDELMRLRSQRQHSVSEAEMHVNNLMTRAQALERSDAGQYDLITLQRRLLHEKDEEIRFLSELVGAHKEQVNIFYQYLETEENDSKLRDTYNHYTVDMQTHGSLYSNESAKQRLRRIRQEIKPTTSTYIQPPPTYMPPPMPPMQARSISPSPRLPVTMPSSSRTDDTAEF